MEQPDKILITGAHGMVGRALVRVLHFEGFEHLVCPKKSELDLRRQTEVEAFFTREKPDYVFHLAAIVGGIRANQNDPVSFIYDNTQMNLNVIHQAHHHSVKKLLLPGSACAYPKLDRPITEHDFLSATIEATNLPYAMAKINGLVTAQSYARQYGLNIVLPMPTNAYGVDDHLDMDKSHVIPALMQKFHQAKSSNLPQVSIWGSGQPIREFIYADDLARALLHVMRHHHSDTLINIGTAQCISIRDLAYMIAKLFDYHGDICFDPTQPDGAPFKSLDSTQLFHLGWQPQVNLEQGLSQIQQAMFKTPNRVKELY